MSTTEILLIAFFINLGIALGAGLYEARIVLPLWFHKTANKNYRVDVEAMRNIDTGRKFWALVTTIPLTLLTIINFVFAYKAAAPLHDWWMSATIIVLLERRDICIFYSHGNKITEGCKFTCCKNQEHGFLVDTLKLFPELINPGCASRFS